MSLEHTMLFAKLLSERLVRRAPRDNCHPELPTLNIWLSDQLRRVLWRLGEVMAFVPVLRRCTGDMAERMLTALHLYYTSLVSSIDCM